MVARFTGIIRWVGAVDRRSSRPNVGTQFRIRLPLATALGGIRFNHLGRKGSFKV